MGERARSNLRVVKIVTMIFISVCVKNAIGSSLEDRGKHVTNWPASTIGRWRNGDRNPLMMDGGAAIIRAVRALLLACSYASCLTFVRLACIVTSVCTITACDVSTTAQTYFLSHHYPPHGPAILIKNSSALLVPTYEEQRQTLGVLNIETGRMSSLDLPTQRILGFSYDAGMNQIVYAASTRDSSGTRLSIISLEDRAEKLLLQRPGLIFAPRFEPKGERIVFSYQENEPRVRGADLWLITTDGQTLTQLTESMGNDAEALWMPESESIVFFRAEKFSSNSPIAKSRWRDWRPMQMNLVGEPQLIDLKIEESSNVCWPQVSPDGRWLVYGDTGSIYGQLRLIALRKSDLDEARRAESELMRALTELLHCDRIYMQAPIFSLDSQALFFLAAPVVPGDASSQSVVYKTDLYRFELNEYSLRRMTFESGWIQNPIPTVDSVMFFVEESAGKRHRLLGVNLENSSVSCLVGCDAGIRIFDQQIFE